MFIIVLKRRNTMQSIKISTNFSPNKQYLSTITISETHRNKNLQLISFPALFCDNETWTLNIRITVYEIRRAAKPTGITTKEPKIKLTLTKILD
jgi:hypothetical protein